MDREVSVWKSDSELFIKPAPANYTKIYENYQWKNSLVGSNVISLPINNRTTVFTVVSFYDQFIVRKDFNLQDFLPERTSDYQPGDILVASDNIKEELSGYMGHSALVVDNENVIEATGGHPAIVKDTIRQFKQKHPIHAQLRPKNKDVGQKAAEFAIEYLSKYKENLSKDLKKPVFSFQLSQELEDLWEYTYCSKLIWACYHYGAGYTFKNDHLWFSPEDLYNQLIDNKDFELVYQHPDVKFLLNT
ncbi:hypothetical protein F9U64_08865 [Gracilibacillus oryzae]|uniref:Uncharacterized protein n=1 Tax=Gracilibacillus oryzae TaxID=1672701 RepID=A0A7C8GTI8_9BACI|nr:hypothetical protein [Gracilibacillus oryzae]KAB8137616.1 hypothetical protein F9U64_08865 [Gracilibacillus oryzae]